MTTTVEGLDNENEQIQQRREKLNQWRESGGAYPSGQGKSHFSVQLHDAFGSLSLEELENKSVDVVASGRIMTRRIMGKASFCTIQDGFGQIQAYVARDFLPEGDYAMFKQWDIGDIVEVRGCLFKTKTGELSIKAHHVKLLTKALRPLPDKYHGLHDREICSRQRYLDIMVNEKTREAFKVRIQLVKAIRDFFDARSFLEVETPMMHPLVGGAAARPFITHHNTLDMALYLRIAPELYLKRLVVGGFERVYEINRNFRNEGISTRHNPEFTMLEFYQAYANYLDLMDLTEELFKFLAQKVLSSTELNFQGERIDLNQPFKRIALKQSILDANSNITSEMLDHFESAKNLAKEMGIEVTSHMGLGKIHMELFESLVEKTLKQPTFITEFPTEVSPLSRVNDENPLVTDRFELYVGGQEVANGFSELNDPQLQARRFEEQLKAKDLGDAEAMSFDQDYITALEYGLPPTAGEGIGIDRLAMLFCDVASIRDVILFPQLRHKV